MDDAMTGAPLTPLPRDEVASPSGLPPEVEFGINLVCRRAFSRGMRYAKSGLAEDAPDGRSELRAALLTWVSRRDPEREWVAAQHEGTGLWFAIEVRGGPVPQSYRSVVLSGTEAEARAVSSALNALHGTPAVEPRRDPEGLRDLTPMLATWFAANDSQGREVNERRASQLAAALRLHQVPAPPEEPQ